MHAQQLRHPCIPSALRCQGGWLPVQPAGSSSALGTAAAGNGPAAGSSGSDGHVSLTFQVGLKG